MDLSDLLPKPPTIEDGLLVSCRNGGDYAPILFEWYKFVGEICCFLASIRPDSEDIREIPPLHYATLIGLLSRCSRLMLSNIALSHNGLFGETTAIIDRCIYESAIKAMWLCAKGDGESFDRLIYDGLKTEIEFKAQIATNIANRGGVALAIEQRMLSSIQNYFDSANATEQVVIDSPKLPDMASMIQVIGGDRLFYVVSQKIGSHHVHGTWVSLRRDYLDEYDGILGPRGDGCETHQNQYVYIMLVVLNALEAFVQFACKDDDAAEVPRALIGDVRREVESLNIEVVGKDFEHVPQL